MHNIRLFALWLPIAVSISEVSEVLTSSRCLYGEVETFWCQKSNFLKEEWFFDGYTEVLTSLLATLDSFLLYDNLFDRNLNQKTREAERCLE